MPTVAPNAALQRFDAVYNATKTYTASHRGFFKGKMFVNTNHYSAEVRINGVTIAGLPYVNTGSGSTADSVMIQARFCVPVAEGDTIQLQAPKGGFEELLIAGIRWV